MKQVIVGQFGEPEVLKLQEAETPTPGPGQVVVRLTSIGMNHAELLGRKGGYKASTGEPPFVPGIEGGGIIEAVGEGVENVRLGQRVALGPNLPRSVDGPHGGTYRSHMLVDADVALPAPDAIPEEQLGAIWLPYLTAWGCLVWKHGIKEGERVGIPAASSSVGLAAAQVVRYTGGIPIGLTSSPEKVEAIEALETNAFEHLVVTHDRKDGKREMRPWHREMKELTGGEGVNVFFDPVAAGAYLSTEVRSLATGGRVYIYGLLGKPDVVDLQPLIIRRGGIETFILYELVAAGEEAWRGACEQIFAAFEEGAFRQHIAATFRLDNVQEAHYEMEKGAHIGKLVLVP